MTFTETLLTYETMQIGRITVEKRRDDYMAFANGNREQWESGSTMEEAIGKLVVSHPELVQ